MGETKLQGVNFETPLNLSGSIIPIVSGVDNLGAPNNAFGTIYVDNIAGAGSFVSKTGDTMTGALQMSNAGIRDTSSIVRPTFVGIALGSSNRASGVYSSAFGSSNIIDENSTESFANGNNNNVINSQQAYVGGSNSAAYQGGNGSFAHGSNAIASGVTCFAIGSSTVARGSQSSAEGSSTQTHSGFTGQHAEGINTIASGTAAHAEGNNSDALASYSHVEGDSNTARGDSSHAEGRLNTTYGADSHVGGLNSIASGSRSFAHGNAAIATGLDSFALGASVTTNSDNTMILGFTNGITLANGTDFLTETSGVGTIGTAAIPFEQVFTKTMNATNISGLSPITISADEINLVGTTNVNGSAVDTPVYNEVPTGLINGINKNFDLSNNPVLNSERVYASGSRMAPSGVGLANYDYTVISGNTVSFISAPASGINILVDYTY